jgi:hypothetical protein
VTMDSLLKQRQLALFEQICKQFPTNITKQKANKIRAWIAEGSLQDHPAPTGASRTSVRMHAAAQGKN